MKSIPIDSLFRSLREAVSGTELVLLILAGLGIVAYFAIYWTTRILPTLKWLVAMFPISTGNEKGEPDNRLKNLDTIDSFLKSKSYDEYKTAFVYMRQHRYFNNEILSTLASIIQKKGAYRRIHWIDDQERTRVLHVYCYAVTQTLATAQSKDIDVIIVDPCSGFKNYSSGS